MTRLMNKHTLKFGGEWRKNTDMLLQTQDAGGSRGRFAFTASGTGIPAEPASMSGMANSLAVVPARLAEHRAARPEGVRRAGHQALGDRRVRPRQVADPVEHHRRPRPALGVLLRRSRASTARARSSNYDPSTNTIQVAGYGDYDNALNVKKYFKNFAPRTGISWRLDDKSVVRAGYGASTIPFPDNRYAFNYPGEAELQRHGGERLPARRARWRPASRRRRCSTFPADGIDPGRPGSLLNSTLDVIPTGLHEGTLHSWNVAFQRQLPFRLHRRHRLRRQPRRRPRAGRRHATRAWSTAPATTDGRSSRSSTAPARRATRTNVGKSQLPRPADEDRSPVPQRLPDHQLVHAEPLDGPTRREHRHRHADRLRPELGARPTLRSHCTTTC